MADPLSSRDDYAVHRKDYEDGMDPMTDNGVTDDPSAVPRVTSSNFPPQASSPSSTRRLSSSLPPAPPLGSATRPPRNNTAVPRQTVDDDDDLSQHMSPSQQPPPLSAFGRPPSAQGGYARPPSNMGTSQQRQLGGSTRGDPFGGSGLRRGSQLNPNAGSMLRDVRSNSSMGRKADLATLMIRGDAGSSVRHGLPPPQVVSSTPSESKLGNFSSEDRQFMSQRQHADAEEEGEGEDGPLFIPSMKREQFIPVRIAREKVKEVLAEMAVMRNKHMAAIETMEKQHQYLKNQLEGACAAYAKKLTNDYNVRVNALDQEYCRRLARLTPASAQQEVEERLTNARKNADELERKTELRVAEKDAELETTRNQLSLLLDKERKLRDELQEKLRLEEERARDLEERVVSLEKQVEQLNDGKPVFAHGGGGISSHSHSSPQKLTQLEEENARLREQVTALNNELDEVYDEDQQHIEGQEGSVRSGGRRPRGESPNLQVDDDDLMNETKRGPITTSLPGGVEEEEGGGGKTLDDGGIGGRRRQHEFDDDGGAFSEVTREDDQAM